MTEEPVPTGQPDNLFQPVAGLHRLEGRFGDKALDKAPSLASETVGKLVLGLGFVVAFAAVWRRPIQATHHRPASRSSAFGSITLSGVRCRPLN